MVLDPASGPLAGGDDGVGRLVEPALIVDAAIEMLALSQRKRFVSPQSSGVSSELLGSLATKKDMAGVKVLVSAGGTREPIDPVRFISNRSSGKQGYALALEALLRGAEVTVVTAAEGIDPPAGTEVVRVETVAEMEREMTSRARAADVVVMAAAVSDFRPSKASSEKLSRAQGPVELVLEPAPDILSELVRLRRPNQVIVGFAAETADVLDRGRAKLEAKGVDLMVANDVSLPGVGFGWDTNAVEIILPGGSSKSVPLTTKAAVARAVFDSVVERMEASVVKRLEATGADLGSAAPRCTSPAMSSKEES
jgi:phosphopantothenoylcysteine decarboxylase/phosphopantothenate--cysteine ligase